ncbi:MAG: hypothetical protein KatS3mg109_1862 [Pirellulaceae bacterium]|nr:MAG: hypothetical protein KatS3mg109_1862 [Pirellulaceae bacterium]
MHVAITGGYGLVGRALQQQLRQAGHTVSIITRHPRSEQDIPWNPEESFLPIERLASVEVVFHLAGENIASGRWNAATQARIRDSRVRGTQLISSTVAQLGSAPALICASAIGYYGDRGDTWLDESVGPGEGFLADVCRQWEQAAEPARLAGLRVVHMRIGVVLAIEGGALAKMLLPFRLGLGGRIGSGRQYWSWIELSDLAAMMVFVMEHAELSGPVNAVAPQPVTNQEFTRTLARVLRRPAFLPMPAWAARLALGKMADELLLASTRVSPAKIRAAGYAFRFEQLEPALRHVLGRPAPAE